MGKSRGLDDRRSRCEESTVLISITAAAAIHPPAGDQPGQAGAREQASDWL
jgi:hypothetical protein